MIQVSLCASIFTHSTFGLTEATLLFFLFFSSDSRALIAHRRCVHQYFSLEIYCQSSFFTHLESNFGIQTKLPLTFSPFVIWSFFTLFSIFLFFLFSSLSYSLHILPCNKQFLGVITYLYPNLLHVWCILISFSLTSLSKLVLYNYAVKVLYSC